MSTGQEPLAPQNETTSKPESDNAKTPKQDSDPPLQEQKTPSENETTSEPKSHDAETSKQDSDPHLQEQRTPPENETISEPKSDDAETLKQDFDPHLQEQKTPSDQNEATSGPKSDDAETSKQDSDPHLQEQKTPSDQNEATSEPKSDDAETSKQDSDPHLQEQKTPSDQNEATSEPKSDDAETSKQDSDPHLQEQKTPSDQNEATLEPKSHDAETSKQDSDPHLQEQKTPSGNETTSEPKSHDAETSKQDSDPHLQEQKTPSEDETTSKNDPARPETTNEREIDDTEANKHGLAADAPARVQEITSVEDETASKDSSPPKIIETHEKETDDNKSLKEKPAKDPKRISKWRKILNLFTGSSKNSQPGSPVVSEDPVRQSDPKALSNLIRADVDYIEKGAKNLGKYSDRLNLVLKQASNDFEELNKQEKAPPSEDLTEMRKAMTKLKLQIPPKLQAEKDEKDLYKNLQLRSKAKQTIPDKVLDMIPQLHKNGVFERSIEFKDFEARYNKLTQNLKLCLLCFSIFPENAIIRKRLMLQWWVAEGFVPEHAANERFKELIREGFIDPVNDNKSLNIGLCQMHPFYRSALITLAERAKFFNFDQKGMPTQNFSGSFQACLVGEGLISYDDWVDSKISLDDLEKIHLLMNAKEPTLEFKDEWFSKMTNVNLLYLGRWGVSPKDHIEVEDTKFLKGFVNMHCMKFLSLQGISNIIYLPESLLQLTNLKILDLRACHNLETLPERIGLLKSLTHLDMSECYLLNHMPKSLSSLMRLKVLKGFVVGSEKGKSSCKLDDLNKLKNLIKLCIYTGLENFPKEEHVRALENLKELQKLTITWGGKALRAENRDAKHEEEETEGSSKNGDAKHKKKDRKGSSGDAEHEKKKRKGSSEDRDAKLERKETKVSSENRDAKLERKETKASSENRNAKLERKETKRSSENPDAKHEKKVMKGSSNSGSESTGKLPPKLEKLDLKCFPMSKTPNWLALENLKDLNLKKLYIRGGKFSDLGQYQDWNVDKKYTWKVEILRLKYLSEIEVEWRQLQELFPDLRYLEQVSCPKLTLVPCDANGVWINQKKLKESRGILP